MNNDPMQDKPAFSLKSEIKKRKTQEFLRTMENKRIAQARGETVSNVNPPRSSDARPSVSVQRTTPEARSTVESRRVTQTSVFNEQTAQPALSKLQAVNIPRRYLIPGSLAVGLVMIVLIGSFSLIGTSSAVQITPTMLALPTITASNFVDYLKRVGVQVANVRQLPVDSASWSATQEIQFDLQNSANKGTFIILSYSSQDQTVSDSFKANQSLKFKDWQITALSNILLLTTPDTASEFRSEIASHATSYLLAPYRPFLPSPTP